MPALGHALLLQGGELERAGQGQRPSRDHPGMRLQPRGVIDQPMDTDVLQERHRPERAPHQEIGGQEGRTDGGRLRLPGGSDSEQPDHRQARRKHHRHHHHLPGHQEQRQGEPQRRGRLEAAPLDQPAVVQQDRLPTRLGGHRDHPGDGDGRQGGRRYPPAAPLGQLWCFGRGGHLATRPRTRCGSPTGWRCALRRTTPSRTPAGSRCSWRPSTRMRENPAPWRRRSHEAW